MSVEYKPVLIYGYPITYDEYLRILDDEEYEDYVICMDSWDDCGECYLGYSVRPSIEPGIAYEVDNVFPSETAGDLDVLANIAKKHNIELPPFSKTYFGVRVC